jgi:hypothetical protein
VFHYAPVHDTIEVETAKLNTSPGRLDPKPFPEMRPFARNSNSYPLILGNDLVHPESEVRKSVTDRPQVCFDPSRTCARTRRRIVINIGVSNVFGDVSKSAIGYDPMIIVEDESLVHGG